MQSQTGTDGYIYTPARVTVTLSPPSSSLSFALLVAPVSGHTVVVDMHHPPPSPPPVRYCSLSGPCTPASLSLALNAPAARSSPPART